MMLQQWYTRSDPRGQFPRLAGFPGIEHNRLGTFWRPIIDMTDSPYSAMRLRMIRRVNDWLADPGTLHRSWFAMIGVPGLRRQVIRHAGLHDYDCDGPAGLAEHLQTPAWRRLTTAISNYRDLDDSARCLVVFQLAQLSLTNDVFTLAGAVQPSGVPDHDRYAYEVARVHARYPRRTRSALTIFRTLSESAADRVLQLEACFQGIGHSLRDTGDLELAQSFELRGKSVRVVPGSAYDVLIWSHFHRACAMLRRREGNLRGADSELARALDLNKQLKTIVTCQAQKLAYGENTRRLLELQIQMSGDAGAVDEVRDLCVALGRLDPYCVEARLVIGDGLAGIGDLSGAARWYSAAGELGTTAGAVGWFRAGQCQHALDNSAEAINAMGRCLELDVTAIEPRKYLDAL